MTTDYHTPIAVGAPVNSAIVNAPLAELDEELGDLIEGSVTGATAQAQPFTVGISLADTTTNATGIIYKAANHFIHNFHHPTGNTAVPAGANTFIGVSSGNFTMGSTASETYHGSYNIGIGYNTLTAVTTGSRNTAIGVSALSADTTGLDNIGVGFGVLNACTTASQNVGFGTYALTALVSGEGHNTALGASTLRTTTTGEFNTAVGANALRATTTGYGNAALGYAALYSNANGVNNAAVGANALENNTGGAFNVAVGSSALYNNTTGLYNIAIGTDAGRYQANGSTALETANYSIYIGYNACGKDNDDDNSIVIGTSAIGLGANTTAIGTSATTVTELRGGSLRINEMSAPTGEANKATIYAVDNGAGKTKLMVVFGSGSAQQLAIEP